MEKDDQTWLNVGYAVFFILFAYITYKAIEMVGIQVGWAERYEWYDMVQTLVGIAISAVVTLLLRRNKDRNEYLLASIGELRKVKWPSWPDVKKMTIVVVVVVAIFAMIMGTFDIIWAKALSFII